jgi:hypothetical protein
VTGYVVSDDDMPNIPWPGRRDTSAIEDAALAALLSGHQPDDLPAGLQPAADVVAALMARPAGDELAGETLAMAEFRKRVGVSDLSRRSRRRRPAVLTSLMSAKVAVAAAAVAITLGGVATAAYAGALPASAQSIAHDWIDAPAAHKGSHPAGPASGPVATRPAAHPLCAAYAQAAAHGTAAQKAAAFRKLAAAAGGATKIGAYCWPDHPRGHHHWRRPFCWPTPNASWSARSQPSGSAHPMPTSVPNARPSWSPRPQPTPSLSCPPVPAPGRTSRPHRHWAPFPVSKHHAGPHLGRPGLPISKPSRPAAGPTPSPAM